MNFQLSALNLESAKDVARYLPPILGLFGTWLSFLISASLREYFKKQKGLLFAIFGLSAYLSYLLVAVCSWLWSPGWVILLLVAAIVALIAFVLFVHFRGDGERQTSNTQRPTQALRDKAERKQRWFFPITLALYLTAVCLLALSGSIFTMLGQLAYIRFDSTESPHTLKIAFSDPPSVFVSLPFVKESKGLPSTSKQTYRCLLRADRLAKAVFFVVLSGEANDESELWDRTHLEEDPKLEIFSKSYRLIQ